MSSGGLANIQNIFRGEISWEFKFKFHGLREVIFLNIV